MKFFLLLIFLCSCQPKSQIQVIQGKVFGSTFVIKYFGKPHPGLEEVILDYFEKFNQEFSTYQKETVISRFNHLKANEEIKVSTRFIALYKKTLKLYLDSQKKFDPTIGPLIKLYGFNSSKRIDPPSKKEIEKTLKKVGYQYIRHRDGNLAKKVDGVELNFNSVAPGFAADELSEILLRRKIKNFMVDIGGEIVLKGYRHPSSKSSWIIGIEKPLKNQRKVRLRIALKDKAIATSGSYRQFLRFKDLKVSHILDPTTGLPAPDRVVSVTVIAPSGFLADGWATILMTMGPKGFKYAQSYDLGVFMMLEENGRIREMMNESFKKYLKDQ